LAEQQEMTKRGVFSQGRPAWVSGKIAPEQTRPQAPGGFRKSIQSKLFGVVDDEGGSAAKDSREDSRQGSARLSPLDRIEESCPGMSDEAESALLTEDIAKRVIKYEKVVARCPGSIDLWTWLGRDYKSIGNKDKAQAAALRALTIDPRDEAAKALKSSLDEMSSSK